MPARHFRQGARLLALAFLSLAILAAPSPAAEKGLQTDLSWGITDLDQSRTMDALDGTGVQWIRLDISWRNTELLPGVYDPINLALTDRAVTLAEQAGARIIMMVNESPLWASGSLNPNTPPQDPADYANFVRGMAARYEGRVAAWEIWNEPNHPRFWQPQPHAAGYAALLRAAYPAVKQGDPQAKVLFGGIAFNDYAYLERVYAADPNIGDVFDVMATHPYTASGQAPNVVDRTDDGRMTTTSFLAFDEVRKLMRSHGDEEPIWLTEFGWSTNSLVTHPLGGVTEQQQADYLSQAFDLLESSPDVEVAIVYNFRNNYWALDADNWEDQLGLLRTDFSPKPAYAVFRDYEPPAEEAPVEDVPAPPVAVDVPSGTGPATSPSVLPPTVPTGDRRQRPGITLEVKRLSAGSQSSITRNRSRLRIVGRLVTAATGHARVILQRRAGGTWRHARTLRAKVRHRRFARTVTVTGGKRWRIRAVHGKGAAAVRARPVVLRG